MIDFLKDSAFSPGNNYLSGDITVEVSIDGFTSCKRNFIN
jgi:hypothetical protein